MSPRSESLLWVTNGTCLRNQYTYIIFEAVLSFGELSILARCLCTVDTDCCRPPLSRPPCLWSKLKIRLIKQSPIRHQRVDWSLLALQCASFDCSAEVRQDTHLSASLNSYFNMHRPILPKPSALWAFIRCWLRKAHRPLPKSSAGRVEMLLKFDLASLAKNKERQYETLKGPRSLT